MITTAGANIPFNLSGNNTADTFFLGSGTSTPTTTIPDAVHLHSSSDTSPLWALAGVVGILVAIKFASEHESAKLDPKIIGVGVYNLVAISLMATLGITAEKIIFNKYPIKGITSIVNAV